MARPSATTPGGGIPRFATLASICVVVAALYFAQDVLIPFALAILLTFLLTPLVIRLERHRLGRVPSVVIVGLLALSLVVALGYLVFLQAQDLANDLPVYTQNISKKLDRFRPSRDGLFERLEKAGDAISEHVTKPSTEPSTEPTTHPNTRVNPAKPPIIAPAATATTEPAGTKLNPFWVLISQQASTPMRVMLAAINKVVSPLGTAGIVVVFTFFMLLAREDLRDRLIRLVGHGSLTVTTTALTDAAQRVSRYLLAQSIVNGTYGLAIAIGLWLIGVPNPLLFGLLCALLRFIPYIGPWIGATFPIIVAVGKFEGSTQVIETIGLFVVIELLSNNLMEPWLYGSSTGISTVAVLVAAVFWTWLWGPVGLLLSTPLTVVLVVMGKYVPQLAFLDILLSDEPVLQPPERVYQRLLARDQEEATDLVRNYRKEMSLEDVYDHVLIPAVALAEQDHYEGRLDEKRQHFVRQAMREIIDELGDDERAEEIRRAAAETEQVAKQDSAPLAGDGQPIAATRTVLPEGCVIQVVLLPAHDEADEIINLILTQLLELRGYCAFSISVDALASEMLEEIQERRADAVVVSALPPAAVAHARYLCKRVHGRFPETSMIVGLWSYKGDIRKATARVACESNSAVVTTLQDGIRELQKLVQPLLSQNPQATAQDSQVATHNSQERSKKQEVQQAPKRRK